MTRECAICGGPNDVGEVCRACAPTNTCAPFNVDYEAAGGWAAQDAGMGE